MVTRALVILAPPVPRRYGQFSDNLLLFCVDHPCQVPVTEALTYGSIRWLAPELVTESSYIPTTRATDVWSFGMVSLEIFTDNVPFSHISNEAYIPLVIRDGPLPIRPEQSATMRGLSDAFWNLMNQCWQRDPKSRPSMSIIRETIQNIHPIRSCKWYN
jgi:son of sevenless-like protein